MVPQAVEAKAKHGLPSIRSALPSERALHHVADQVLHLGYGSALGAAYGLILGRRPAGLKKIVVYGLSVWGVGSFVLLPGLRIMRPEWRAKPSEVLVNLSAHLLYAATVALVTEEFATQSYLQPLQYPASLVARTG